MNQGYYLGISLIEDCNFHASVVYARRGRAGIYPPVNAPNLYSAESGTPTS